MCLIPCALTSYSDSACGLYRNSDILLTKSRRERILSNNTLLMIPVRNKLEFTADMFNRCSVELDDALFGSVLFQWHIMEHRGTTVQWGVNMTCPRLPLRENILLLAYLHEYKSLVPGRYPDRMWAVPGDILGHTIIYSLAYLQMVRGGKVVEAFPAFFCILPKSTSAVHCA